jgi:YggT family protein
MTVDFHNYLPFYLSQLFLAAVMYTLLGKFILSFFFPPESDKVIWRAFDTLTKPFLAAARFVTPRIIHDRLLILFAFVWVLFARIGLFVAFSAAGMRPQIGV